MPTSKYRRKAKELVIRGALKISAVLILDYSRVHMLSLYGDSDSPAIATLDQLLLLRNKLFDGFILIISRPGLIMIFGKVTGQK